MPFKKSKHFKFLYKIDILVIFLLLIGFSSLSINLYIIFNSDIDLRFKVISGVIDIFLIIGLIYSILNFIDEIIRKLRFSIRQELIEEFIKNIEEHQKDLKLKK